jgi:hypothetical protein
MDYRTSDAIEKFIAMEMALDSYEAAEMRLEKALMYDIDRTAYARATEKIHAEYETKRVVNRQKV